MTARWITADVFDGLKTLEDGSVDLVVTSPPFLALRSYLPADHPDKGKEIGSEPTPAAFIDVMLAVTAELRRVLAPHGSICVELGDTYAGSGGAGGDYNPGGWREGQEGYRQQGRVAGRVYDPKHNNAGIWNLDGKVQGGGEGWPLAKSKTLIPELYRLALAYGINPLTGQESPAGRWRVRNVVTWCRPNPPVGALGDKWRPATSDIVIACTSDKRYWDDIATRRHNNPERFHEGAGFIKARIGGMADLRPGKTDANPDYRTTPEERSWNHHGAPLLDYWELPPGGYSGKVLTVHREPCGPDDGGERTTSPDCPLHGDQAVQASTAPDDERAGTSQTRTPRTDDRPVQGQLDDSAPTDPHPEPETAESNSGSPRLTCAPSAIPNSTASNRTDPAPGTNPSDTPSAQTAGHTDGKPESPESGERRPDNPESNTSGDGSPDSPESQSPARTADSDKEPVSSEACSCSWSKVVKEEYTSHYAVYPPALVEPLIKAMAPPKVCQTCGEPSRRIVGEPTYEAARQAFTEDTMPGKGFRDAGPIRGLSGTKAPAWKSQDTLGWSDCGHDNWRPAHILDCFGGSGTTLSVATGHGHTATGIDLDERNRDLALERIGPFLFEEVAL